MKKACIIAIFGILLTSCEDQIFPTLDQAPEVLVIDAFLDNSDSVQQVRLTKTQGYFNNTLATGVEGATVTITSTGGGLITFAETGAGLYTWIPNEGNPLGQVGETFTLRVSIAGQEFQAQSTMNRVPPIDSVTFRFEEENLFLPDSYFAEFWARDPLGRGDTYWIRSYKNGVFLNQPNEINIAFDAGFSEGGNVDGLVFIPPVRDAINPFEEDENDEFMSPFADGDSVFVEVLSITNETFDFLNELRTQTDRPGGFAELFATPLSNIPTNLNYVGEGDPPPVLGFFSVSAISASGKKLDISEVPQGN